MQHLGIEQLRGFGVIDELSWRDEKDRFKKPTVELPSAMLTPRRGGASSSNQRSILET